MRKILVLMIVLLAATVSAAQYETIGDGFNTMISDYRYYGIDVVIGDNEHSADVRAATQLAKKITEETGETKQLLNAWKITSIFDNNMMLCFTV